MTEVKFKSNVPKINKIKSERIDVALNRIGQFVESEAKINAPVDTGRLRNSINYSVKGHEGGYGYSDDNGNTYSAQLPGVEENTVIIGTPVEYAPIVETGGSNRKAVNFLRNSITRNKTQIKKIFEESLNV